MDHIKKFWDSNADQFQESHWASWGDEYAIDLEIQNISNYIEDGNNVLDIGCANGYSALRQLEKKKINILGIDYSEPMIDFANKTKDKLKLENIDFEVGDIRNIVKDDESFDVTYTTRVLINLPTWEEQITGINECLRVTKKGGVVLLSEAFWEPLVLLNSVRTLKGLESLVEHDFNRYLKLKKVEKYLNEKNLSYNIIDFSSIYYLGSRFLRDLVTDVNAHEGYSNPINKIFYDIEKEFSGGGFGIQQCIVINKK